jgi:predicted amidohydrolase
VISGTYVISVNRPRPEHGASIGGPSIAISPSGEVIAETQDTVTIVDLSRSVVEQAGAAYPGYLARFPGLYSDA